MIYRESKPGMECSIIELGGVRYVFAAAVPRQGVDFIEQARDVLGNLDGVLREQDLSGSIVNQTVFLSDFTDWKVCRQMMGDFYGEAMPAMTYLAQPPGEGQRLAVEAWGVGPGRGEVEIERAGGELSVVRHDGLAWAHLAYCPQEARHSCLTEMTGNNATGKNACPPDPEAIGSVYYDSLSALHAAGGRLADAGFRFEDMVRTWLYLGDITATEGHFNQEAGHSCLAEMTGKNATGKNATGKNACPPTASGQTLRYHQLNRARTDFYRDKKFAAGLLPQKWNRSVYPASTGIGVRGDGLAVSCLALKTARPDVLLLPLENPRQTSAHDYGQSFGADSPKFARAMAVVLNDCTLTFISGTASIVTAESRHLDQVERQTQETLDNIEMLISPENFDGHGFPGLGATLGDLVQARIYLKRADDYGRVRAICRERLGELPAIYAVCDLCRPELLVEIEGIAVKKKENIL